MRTATKRPKPKTPKPHPMAFIRESGPCEVCGCEWFRPTIQFVEADPEVKEGCACANLWCPMIGQLRDIATKLLKERRLLAMLAAETPQFDNPLIAWEAQALRDKVLAKASSLTAGVVGEP